MVKVGIAFGDYISKGDYKRNNWGYGDDGHRSRGYFLGILAAALFSIIFFRLFFLQIIQGYYYKDLSDNNRTKTVKIHAPRGIIFDRNGTPLVFNVPGFRETIKGKTILIPQDQALNLIAAGKNNLEVDSLRNYPYKDAFAHVLGYIGQISQDQLKDPLYSNYSVDDIVGQSGIEEEYESKLKGIDGRVLYEVDAKGNLTRKLGQQDAIAGENITLTLDAKLQQAVYEAMKDVKKGAAIVSAPDGEILAMVSKPAFDPNLFTMGQGYKISSSSSYLTLSDVLLDSQNQPHSFLQQHKGQEFCCPDGDFVDQTQMLNNLSEIGHALGRHTEGKY